LEEDYNSGRPGIAGAIASRSNDWCVDRTPSWQESDGGSSGSVIKLSITVLVEQMLTNYVVVGLELSVVVIVGLAIYLIKKK